MIQTEEIQPDALAIARSLGDRRLSSIRPAPSPAFPVPGCDWLRTGRLSLLTGREGSGKSSLARQVCAAATSGIHWLEPVDGWTRADYPEPYDQAVLWISGDGETPAEVRRHFSRFYPPDEYLPDLIHAYTVDDVRSPDVLAALCYLHRPRLVVVDPVGMLFKVERADYDSIYRAMASWFPPVMAATEATTDEHVTDNYPDISEAEAAEMVEAGALNADGYFVGVERRVARPACLLLHHQHREREGARDSVSGSVSL